MKGHSPRTNPLFIFFAVEAEKQSGKGRRGAGA
jgi:hypothetical protein